MVTITLTDEECEFIIESRSDRLLRGSALSLIATRIESARHALATADLSGMAPRCTCGPKYNPDGPFVRAIDRDCPNHGFAPDHPARCTCGDPTDINTRHRWNGSPCVGLERVE